MRFKVYYRVSTGDRVRFEALSLDECQSFARDLYMSENVIANIDEIRRDGR